MAKKAKTAKKRSKLKVVLIVAACVLALLVALGAGFVWYSSHQYITKKPALLKSYPYSENQGRVLLAGSSFMENWTTWQEDTAPLDTMNVAIGGTKVADWQDMYEELIVPYNPSAIVIYVGSNDINGGRNSKTGEQVAAGVEALLSSITAALPDTPIYYVSISPTIAREGVWADAARSNELVKAYCEANALYHFIDITDAILDENGALRQDIYIYDKLHYNKKGYTLWSAALMEVLAEELG